MNLNKWLCKHMDFGDKGYVTIWDVVKGAGYISLVVTLASFLTITTVWMWLRGASLILQRDILYGDLISGDDMCCVAMFTFINAVIILSVAATVAHKLASIRVATCERKDGD